MSTPTGQHPFHFQSGNRIPADWLNEVSRGIVQRMTGQGMIVRRVGTSIILDADSEMDAPSSGGSAIEMMRVYFVGDDSLKCYRWNGTTLGTETLVVAKPPELRKTGINNQIFSLLYGTFSYTYTDVQARTSTNTADSTNESQVIVPPYEIVHPLDIIFASTPVGGTSLSGVSLQDTNVAGRAWAKETP